MKRRPSRHDIRKAQEHWRLLYHEPPPEKKRPTGQSGPKQNKNTGLSESKDTLSRADRQRENQARAAFLRFVLSLDPDSKRRHLEQMNRAILGRSAAAVAAMEAARRLR